MSTYALCKGCNEWYPEDDFKEIEDAFSCDMCGSHDGLKCPKCEEINDMVFVETKIIEPVIKAI